jgi:hypothetical protein
MSGRFERALAYMVAAVIVLSLASFVALIIGTSVGLARDDFAAGIHRLRADCCSAHRKRCAPGASR